MKAIWNHEVIAESNDTVIVEGNYYFPATAVKREFLSPSDKQTTCPWKGTASYYNLEVKGKTNEAAAWYYSHPKEAAKQIKDRIAFWRGVTIEK